MSIDVMFEPFTIGGFQLRNRFVMPPMQRGMAVDGAPGPDMVDLYRRSAAGGVGLIIAESTAPSHASAFWKKEFCRLDTDTLDSWKSISAAVHEGGARLFHQLWHPGAIRDLGSDTGPSTCASLSPSGLIKRDRPNGRAMDRYDMEEVRDSYVRAARLAIECGADGVELHACHGYLLDQFLWAESNVRTDEYGGEIEGRARFPAEVVAAVRSALKPLTPISIRLSQFKEVDYEAHVARTPDELGRLLTVLKSAGVDIFHISTRRFYEQAWPESPLSLAGWVKALSGSPVIAVGSVGLTTDTFENLFDQKDPELEIEKSLARLALMFAKGEFDLVSVGRAIIATPDWVNKVQANDFRDIRPFNRSMLGDELEKVSDAMGADLKR